MSVADSLVQIKWHNHHMGYACYPCVVVAIGIISDGEEIPEEEFSIYSLREIAVGGVPIKHDKEIQCVIRHKKGERKPLR